MQVPEQILFINNNKKKEKKRKMNKSTRKLLALALALVLALSIVPFSALAAGDNPWTGEWMAEPEAWKNQNQ